MKNNFDMRSDSMIMDFKYTEPALDLEKITQLTVAITPAFESLKNALVEAGKGVQKVFDAIDPEILAEELEEHRREMLFLKHVAEQRRIGLQFVHQEAQRARKELGLPRHRKERPILHAL